MTETQRARKLKALGRLQAKLVVAKRYTTMQRLSLQVEALRKELGL